MSAEVARRFPEHTLKRAIELGERLEADVIGDFADAQVRIEKSDPGIFQANTREVFGELQPSALAKNLAEMKHARPCRLRHTTQR